MPRTNSRGISSSVCLASPTYTVMTPMSSLTEITGTFSERATRSAVRCRVPVSLVGTVGSGTRCTLAQAMRPESGVRMMAESILHTSASRWGVNSAFIWKPPEQMAEHIGLVTHDNERAPLGLDHPVQPVAQPGSR